MQHHPHISIVSPEYKGAKMVQELVDRIATSVSTITEDWEIILVNDASPDDTWSEIEKVCAKDKRVKGLNLSRNFGQHYAITAGLNYAKGDWVVVMDCDLQDRPEEIPNLHKKAQEGYDIVYARRVHKQFGFWKKLSSSFYHAVFNWLSGVQSDSSVANFGIYKAQVIAEYIKLPEKARAFQPLLNCLGFKISTFDVQHADRGEGTSSYNLHRLIKLSADIILANSNKPLKIAVGLGFGMSALSILLAIYNILAKWIGIIQVAGYTTTIFSIWFVGGLILFVMGVLGLYIGKIFNQVKGRPLFIVRDIINL